MGPTYATDGQYATVGHGMRNIGEAFVFMDNNSRPHRAHVVNDFLQDNDVAQIEWPACSPYMNPIEPAWDRFKKGCLWTT